jgi:membrane-associated phospholipid phosphatase
MRKERGRERRESPLDQTTAYPGPDRRRNRFLPQAIGITGGVALAAAAFWFFKEQAEHVVAGRADDLDEKIMDLVHRIDTPAVSTYMRQVTRLGEHSGIIVVALGTAIAMRRSGRRHDAWTVLLNAGGAMALSTAMKAIFQRQRPQELARHIRLPRSHSFPSGHALLSAATFPIAVHHFVQRKSTRVQVAAHAATAFLVGSVGFSRVYLGVHFPSDVMGGYAAGLGWLGLTSLSHTMADRERLR